MGKIVSASVLAAIVAIGMSAGVQVTAADGVPPIEFPPPCDFITGGGFIITKEMAKANFGAHGGCKHGTFWGHVNYVDHGGFSDTKPFHVRSTEITGYFVDPLFPNIRTICGVAMTNAGHSVTFRVRMQDNGTEPDAFEIVLSDGYVQTIRSIEGGSIQLHKPNPSTTGPIQEPICAGGVIIVE